MPSRFRAIAAAVLALVLGSCVTPATEILVMLDTDAPVTVPLNVTVTVRRASMSSGDTTRSWTRATMENDADGGVLFPFSFGVVPGTGGANDATVAFDVAVDAGGARIHRTATVAFVPHTVIRLPIFLTVRCVTPATGCTHSAMCTVQALCEEQGQTCGNGGECVAVGTQGTTDVDASFGDVAPLACGHFHDACCPVGDPCLAGMQCVAGRCQVCPDPAEQCCDVGSMSLLPDGTACGAAPVDPCHVSGTCTAGVCSPPGNAPDGTPCGDPANDCNMPSVCMAGACVPQPLPDGTACGGAPMACQTQSTCVAGVCTEHPQPDGTACGGAGACKVNGTCMGGVCSGPMNEPDGTACGGTPTACHTQSTCVAGACTAHDAADGASCGSAPDACHNAPTCSGGACRAATAKPNGTVCQTTTNPCRTSATCTSGRCGSLGTRPNGYHPSGATSVQRCCGGALVGINTTSNCDACGIRCSSGQSCVQLRGQSQYYCSPCVSNASCWSGCCSYYYGNPYACAASNCSGGCIACPGGSSCRTVSGDPNFCGY